MFDMSLFFSNQMINLQEDYMNNIVISTATYLDLRFKKRYLQNDDEMRAWIKDEIVSRASPNNQNTQNNDQHYCRSSIDALYSAQYYYSSLTTIEEQLEHYDQSTNEPFEVDPAAWWKTH